MYELVFSLGRAFDFGHSTIQEALLATPLLVMLLVAVIVIGAGVSSVLRSMAVFIATRLPRTVRQRLVAR